MRLLSPILVLFLLGSTGSLAISGSPELALQIRAWGFGKVDGRYSEGDPIAIQLILLNTGQHPAEVLLKDHGKDGSQEDFPWGLKARVINQEQEVLTKHNIAVFGKGPDEWWSFGFLHSDRCEVGVDCEMPGDRITLNPGDTVYRVIRLDILLFGAPELDGALPPGEYKVELSLGRLQSNRIAIVIEASDAGS